MASIVWESRKRAIAKTVRAVENWAIEGRGNFMAVKKILTLDKHEKILKTPSEPVKKINREIKQLIKDIFDTMDANPAVGLAAVQIGVLKRVCGIRLSYDEDLEEDVELETIILINPEILESSEELERGYDACLSIPGMMGYTDRNFKIKVRYQDETGKVIEQEFSGWDARVIQHEVDHLDGILFLSRLNPMEDLYVMIPGKDGEPEPIPYREVVKQASDSDGKKPRAKVSESKSNAK
jgi:peptide deformylase